ncbi:MAG: type IV secretion protein Rhs, partial [Patescibacteria group bacterium]
MKNRQTPEALIPPADTNEEIRISPIEDVTSSQSERPDPYANDKDRDGISSEEETLQGTSDSDFDTDGDALSDTAEINQWKTDPKNPDTDG